MSYFSPRQHLARNLKTVTLLSAEEQHTEALYDAFSEVIAEKEFMLFEDTDLEAISHNQRVQEIRQVFENPNSLYLLAVYQNKVIGAISVIQGKCVRYRHIGNLRLFLLDAWRSSGLGKVLTQVAIEWAITTPELERINLGVYTHNEGACKLYEKLGFVYQGVMQAQSKTSDGIYYDEAIMTLDLLPLKQTAPELQTAEIV